MNKLFKKVSAIVLAGAMTLSSSVAAFAADMTVYIRDNGQELATATQRTSTPNIKLSFVIHDVDSSMSLYDALYYAPKVDGMLDSDVKLETSWTKGENEDGTTDQYLTYLKVANTTDGKNFAGLNNGGNKKLYYKDGKVVGGEYEGNSWMWCMMNGNLGSTAYPEDITLSDQACLDTNFGIILSYDYSSFPWGDTSSAE